MLHALFEVIGACSSDLGHVPLLGQFRLLLIDGVNLGRCHTIVVIAHAALAAQLGQSFGVTFHTKSLVGRAKVRRLHATVTRRRVK